jgi:hypothetical protein
MELKHNLGNEVVIIPLDLVGRITQIAITQTGIKYQVRYFYNSEAKEVWLYEDEMRLKQ